MIGLRQKNSDCASFRYSNDRVINMVAPEDFPDTCS